MYTPFLLFILLQISFLFCCFPPGCYLKTERRSRLLCTIREKSGLVSISHPCLLTDFGCVFFRSPADLVWPFETWWYVWMGPVVATVCLHLQWDCSLWALFQPQAIAYLFCCSPFPQWDLRPFLDHPCFIRGLRNPRVLLQTHVLSIL